MLPQPQSSTSEPLTSHSLDCCGGNAIGWTYLLMVRSFWNRTTAISCRNVTESNAGCLINLIRGTLCCVRSSTFLLLLKLFLFKIIARWFNYERLEITSRKSFKIAPIVLTISFHIMTACNGGDYRGILITMSRWNCFASGDQPTTTIMGTGFLEWNHVWLRMHHRWRSTYNKFIYDW